VNLTLSRTREQPIPDFYSEADNWKCTSYTQNNLDLPPTNVQNTSGTVGPIPGGYPRGLQITADENHSSDLKIPLRSGVFHGDIGGEFVSRKWSIRAQNPRAQHIEGTRIIDGNRKTVKYYGPFLAYPPGSVVLPTYSLDSLVGKGTTAIARCKPTNNVANLATSLFELYRDGLPKLFGSSLWEGHTRRAKDAGGEYLNSEFGWKPLVSDIKDFTYGVANASRILKSYERNSGKIVRRRYEFPVEETEVTTLVTGPYDGLYFSGVALTPALDTSKPAPSVFLTTKFHRRTWFSGAFTYHLPLGYHSRNRMVELAAKAGPLLGIELTPEVVWNAQPWTWAIDWFSNTGDVVSNLSDMATDGLVLKWGYLMEHTVLTNTYFLSNNGRYDPPLANYASPVIGSLEVKRRVKATPFGFATSWNGMTPRQLAIAAALGITRVF
jgi:hypothetical protein